ncbi:hypothetical protein PHAVU_003G021000 [Phaseolus vulgaris]|uniref:Protein TIFY n=1 Tax=Phaseolus vulgaris TaxID=3885 RepID=V7C7C2_PHAVU|nr:hypothetical protein PHAVU_003G021000g [Phaseolus vulgaris]ESW25263.1 hypothetical protein PHAVU_003G021000g [Phaseolus vulgaris]
MERDFLGLNSKEPLVVVKEKMNNDSGCKDTGFTKGGMVKWPFMNKVSVHPHLMFLNTPQKSLNHDGQGGIHFSLAPYPALHDVVYMNRPHDVKMLSVPKQTIPVSMGHPSLKNHFTTVGQNMNASGMKQPLLRAIPVTAPHSVLPIVGADADAAPGMTKTCNRVKPSASVPKLTIFYAGTVNVFDDISPQKAQAIMLMARNDLSAASNVVVPNVEAPRLTLAGGDGVHVSKTMPLSSPLSLSSHIGAQSLSGSSSSDEFLAAKTSGGTPLSVNTVETPKVVNTTTMLPSAVPQARKASLARFLEKRKERVLSAAPYNLNKQEV